ncbi:hypothetical protein DPV78_012454 [Talaromyces pinophilus]|nr:hypothetical protein DPV78_012454 [Talaromyces pinophilus]
MRVYSRVEEVHNVISVKDPDPQNVDSTQPRRERETAGPLPLRQINGEDEDIHLYTRVHILGVSFRTNHPASLDNRLQKRQRQIVVRDKDLEDVSYLVHRLAKDLQLPEKDCRVVISEFFAQSIPPAKADGMEWGKTSILPEGPFGQISTQIVSEEAISGNEGHQTHQKLSPFEPHLDLSSSDKDSKVDEMGRFNAQSFADKESNRMPRPSVSSNLVFHRRCRTQVLGRVEYWECHHCLEKWNIELTNECFICGHFRC